MYNLIKNIILSKRFELSEMLKKIDMVWLQGNITLQQRQELVSLAQNNANMENSIDIMNKLNELDAKDRELEALILELKNSNSESNESDNENNEGNDDVENVSYPEYVVGRWYRRGDKISFEGKNYVCIAPEGAVCTWSPTEYPVYWNVIVENVVDESNEDKNIEDESSEESEAIVN